MLRHVTQLRYRSGLRGRLSLSSSRLTSRGCLSRCLRRLQLRQMLHLRLHTQVVYVSHVEQKHT